MAAMQESGCLYNGSHLFGIHPRGVLNLIRHRARNLRNCVTKCA